MTGNDADRANSRSTYEVLSEEPLSTMINSHAMEVFRAAMYAKQVFSWCARLRVQTTSEIDIPQFIDTT
jgi:hypothetical protein